MFRLKKHRARLQAMLKSLRKNKEPEEFKFDHCKNGAIRCLIQLKCFDARKCLHGSPHN